MRRHVGVRIGACVAGVGGLLLGAGQAQTPPPARHQGLDALPARRPAAHARRHRRVLQPDPPDEAHGGGEEGPAGVPEDAL